MILKFVLLCIISSQSVYLRVQHGETFSSSRDARQDQRLWFRQKRMERRFTERNRRRSTSGSFRWNDDGLEWRSQMFQPRNKFYYFSLLLQIT